MKKRVACIVKCKVENSTLNCSQRQLAFSTDTGNLPDISCLHRRRNAVHLAPENAARLACETIATIDLGWNAEWELAENTHSILGILERERKSFYYFTIHDAGWPNAKLRFQPENWYNDFFERLTNEPINLEVFGEVENSLFFIKGIRPVSNATFEELHQILY